MILGDTCTRRCGFCNVKTGKPTWNDPLEPLRVARSVARMGLRHAVITSVDRDDLPDYGATVWCGVIRSIRMQAPDSKIECLTPDFRGEEMPLAKVIAERPDVFNHNVEVVPRLYPVARRGSRWKRSLRVLSNALEMGEGEVVTKSGLMVGLGETHDEMVEAFGDLREAGVSILTVGQYLRPTERHLPVVRYWEPEEFTALEARRLRPRLRAHRRRPARALELPRRRARRAGPPGHRPARRNRRAAPSDQRATVDARAPAARQHPDVADARRHVRADRGQHPRLLLLAEGRARARRPEHEHYICQLQDWAAIPYELTHPAHQVQIAARLRRADDADLR